MHTHRILFKPFRINLPKKKHKNFIKKRFPRRRKNKYLWRTYHCVSRQNFLNRKEDGNPQKWLECFLEQLWNNLENLSGTKIFLCDQRLSKKLGARAKNVDFWRNSFCPSPPPISTRILCSSSKTKHAKLLKKNAFCFNRCPQNMICTHLAHLELGSLTFYSQQFPHFFIFFYASVSLKKIKKYGGKYPFEWAIVFVRSVRPISYFYSTCLTKKKFHCIKKTKFFRLIFFIFF